MFNFQNAMSYEKNNSIRNSFDNESIAKIGQIFNKKIPYWEKIKRNNNVNQQTTSNKISSFFKCHDNRGKRYKYNVSIAKDKSTS